MAPTALFERDRAGNLTVRLPSPRRVIGDLVRRSINWSLDEWDRWLDVTSFGRSTNSGTSVNEHTSLQVSAVYACVKVLVEDISHLPFGVFERLPQGGRSRVHEHPVDRILGRKANPEMAAITLRQTLMGHLALWGNAYAEIVRDGGGRPAELWPLRPDRMTPRRNEKRELVYDYDLPNGQTVRFKRRQILHIAGWGFDGIRGYSPIAMEREGIGLAKALEQFGASYFGNGAHPGGIIEYPGKLSDKGLENYRRSVQEAYGGLGKSHRLMVLEQGLKYHQVGVPPEDSQFLQSRNYQKIDIASIFRMQPHKIGILDRATHSNIEHQAIEHVTDTLMPWLVLWEQVGGMQLFSEPEFDRYYLKHNVTALLRGDMASRYQAYAIGRQWGWLTANKVLELEDMNPMGPDGDIALVPLNMVPAGQAGSDRSMRLARYIAGVDNDGHLQEPESGGRVLRVGPDHDPEVGELRTQRSAASRRRMANSYRRVITEAVARIIRRERADIMREAEKQLRRRSVQELRDFIVRFYAEHRAYISEAMLPAMLAEAEAIQAEAAEEVGAEPGMTPEMEDFVRSYLTAYVARHVGSSQGQLLQVIGEAEQAQADVAATLQTRFDEWQETRPDKTAEWETNQLANAVAKAVFVAAGITRLRWLAFNENCPYCDSLNGRVVGISEWFLPQGGLLQPDGVDVPMTAPRTNVGHPPLHSGCDCAVVAEAGSRGQRPVASERRAVFAAIIAGCRDHEAARKEAHTHGS